MRLKLVRNRHAGAECSQWASDAVFDEIHIRQIKVDMVRKPVSAAGRNVLILDQRIRTLQRHLIESGFD